MCSQLFPVAPTEGAHGKPEVESRVPGPVHFHQPNSIYRVRCDPRSISICGYQVSGMARKTKTLCPQSPAYKCSQHQLQSRNGDRPLNRGTTKPGVGCPEKGCSSGIPRKERPAGTKLSEANQTRDGRVREYRKCPGEASLQRQKPH